MIAQRNAPRTMTVEEWRDLEQASHDAKHEYDDITLESLGVRVPLAALYRRTDVPERQFDVEGEV